MKDATEEPETEDPAVTAGPSMVVEGPLINVEDVDAAAPTGGTSSDSTEVGSDSGKAKDNKKASANAEAEKASGQGLSGRINTLIAADVESVVEGMCGCELSLIRQVETCLLCSSSLRFNSFCVSFSCIVFSVGVRWSVWWSWLPPCHCLVSSPS